MRNIPFALPSIGEREIEAVVETLRSGWLTTGPKTKAFEEAFAAAVGARHALAVNSATAALHLALEALGIGAGDRVLVPTWTFTATADVVRYLGAHPVFVDVDPATLNIDPASVEEQILRLQPEHGAKVKAVMPVHVGGQASEMDQIVSLARRHDLKIIEDAAHAFPTSVESENVTDATRKRRMVGSIGHATAFSFYATKTIATGEGGMVTRPIAATGKQPPASGGTISQGERYRRCGFGSGRATLRRRTRIPTATSAGRIAYRAVGNGKRIDTNKTNRQTTTGRSTERPTGRQGAGLVHVHRACR